MDKFKTAFNVTAWFETGDTPYTNPSGNFDGQGLSWGPRQNCIGQGSLQPLLRKMLASYPGIVATALGALKTGLDNMLARTSTSEQLDYVVKNFNDANNRLLPEWRTALAALGSYPEVQQIFMDDAKGSIPAVDDLAAFIAGSADKITLRIWCLAFDFCTQNGGFSRWFRAALVVLRPMLAPLKKDARDWLRTVCWLRAAQVYILGNRPFALDVLGRKLLIVEGQGKFRGGYVDLDEKFGVTDELVA